MISLTKNSIQNEIKNVMGSGEQYIQMNDAKYLVADALNAGVTTTLGVSINQIQNGVRSLDIARDFLPGGIASANSTITDVIGAIGGAKGAVGGIISGVSNLVPSISGISQSFSSVEYTVSTDSDGFGNEVVSYVTEVASNTSTMASLLSALTGLKGSSFGLTTLSGTALDVISTQAVGLASPTGILDTVKGVVGSVGGLTSITNTLGVASLGSLQNILTSAGLPSSALSLISDKINTNLSGVSLSGNGERDFLRTTIEKIGDVVPSIAELREVAINSLPGTREIRDKSVSAYNEQVTSGTEGTDPAGGTLGQIIQRATGSSEVPAINDILPDPEIPSFNIPFRIGSPESKFTYINSVEELRAEIIGIKRPISEVVVHWTDTYSDKNIGSEEIETFQKTQGHSGIQYHYVIRRDGSLQRGESSSNFTEHTGNNRDTYNIGVAFVGGYNCPSGTVNAKNYASARSLTRAQFNTFDEICEGFYLKFPGIQILGHNDIDGEVIDPGFDVRDYVEAKFNKESLYKDPLTDAFIPPDQLNTKVLK